jgi:hypothetical protein
METAEPDRHLKKQVLDSRPARIKHIQFGI